MRGRWGFGGVTALGFALGTLPWLAPIVPVMGTAYLHAVGHTSPMARADAMLTSWMLAWGAHAVRTDPLGVFDANVFHPLPLTLAFSENLLASALMVLPADLAWENPTLDHNLLVMASFVVAGTGTALLLRELGTGWPAAWLAGTLVAFTPYRALTIGHVHALSMHWMPFALLAVHRCLRRGRGAIAVALGVVLVGLSSVYYAYFFLLALAIVVTSHWLLGCDAAPGGRARVLAGVVAGAVVTGLGLVPYAIASDLYALDRRAGDALFFGARVVDYVGAVASPAEYVRRRYLLGEHGRWLLGIATVAFAVAGTVAGAPRGGRRIGGLYLLVGVALALVSCGPRILWSHASGPTLPGPWSVLAAVVPGFSALRVSVRAGTVAQLAFGVLAGLGADALWRRATRPATRRTVAALLVATAVIEGWRGPFGLTPVPWAAAGVPSVYRWLAAQPDRDAVLELPIGIPEFDAEAMVLSAAHWRPLVNGYSGFTPTLAFHRRVLADFPSPPTAGLLRAIGVRWVVVRAARALPRHAALCRAAPAELPPYVRPAYRDASACVFELGDAPPAPPPPPPDRPVSLTGARVVTWAGDAIPALLDGRLDTHWTELVDATVESWVQLDLPESHTVSRVVLHLGRHFGEHLRRWRLETSLDGAVWQTAAEAHDAPPPLEGLRSDPQRLAQELRLPVATSARHLRVIRPASEPAAGYTDVWVNWRLWGAHEIAVYAR